ncbi:putative polyketide hydroxylase [Kitasatospora sp. MAA4]|uniref:FAD-dependent monooxygenase n=1 Tax=Kitasatospora sp. MAA4 TaxID=3035093 RepID=UPI002472F9D3|nr:FAD-dependent monooxygenase [Kitasatospora sp. MAA4]MDH6132407.1 putative polyketide hydroxylase [Kitasatospora sp. MAA4]
MTVEQTAVLIVGAGPAGLSTAVFLGLHGVTPLVLERRPGTSTAVKATGQYPHTMEAMRAAGVADRLHALSRPFASDFHMVIARTLAGPVLRTLVSGRELSMRQVSPEEWCTASQSSAEAVLAARAGELGAELRFSTRLVSLDQDADGVTAVTEHTVTGERRTVRAQYLVAGDGWRSEVRQALGIGVRGRGVVGRVLRVLFEADLGEALAHTPGAADGSRFAAFHVGRAVLFNTEVPGLFGYFRNLTDDLPAGWEQSEEQVARQLAADLGLAGTALKITEIGETEIACAVAERFREGRVLLVGDAAHVMPPTGGLGGNTAYLDGFYLGWKLAAVIRGAAGPGLLDSHDAERRPYAELLVDQQFANLVERIAPELADDDVPALLAPSTVAFGYRYPVGALIAEPDDDGALIEDPSHPTGRPGSRAAYLPLLTAQGTETSTTALFGHDFVLLTGPDGAAWQQAATTAAARLGLRLAVHGIDGADRGSGQLRDGTGRFAAAYGIGRQGAVLVRPDRFVAWRSPGAVPDPADRLHEVLRTLLHR